MDTQNNNKSSSSDSPLDKDENLQQINQEIYKHNLELAVVNKTLSLLRKLYQISLLTLDPATLSLKISDTIRLGLNLEVVGIFSFNENSDELLPYNFSKSERLVTSINKMGFSINDFKITVVSTRPLLKETVYGRQPTVTSNLKDVWSEIIDDNKISTITKESHIKTILLYPLVSQDNLIGVLLMGLNRNNNTMSNHEKEAIKNFVDVTAIALDKAYLYKELQDANEKLKGLDKLKTEFVSLASHQLRSPLTAIKGYLSMIIEGDYGELNNELKEPIDRVFESSKNLTTIVEDLLNVSKIEQGGMKYSMEPFNLSELARDEVKDLSVNAEKKGLKICFESDGDNLCIVNGDKEKIRQVLLNFIDNSIKYTKTGGINISVKNNENKVLFSIKDTGMGMTPEIKETLFQRFSRGDGARMNTTGSGLGLYLAKEIVEAHKGRVWVESEGPDKGSTFNVELDAIKN